MNHKLTRDNNMTDLFIYDMTLFTDTEENKPSISYHNIIEVKTNHNMEMEEGNYGNSCSDA